MDYELHDHVCDFQINVTRYDVVAPPFSRELMGDKKAQADKISPAYAKLRGAHLDRLSAVEALVRDAAPLPMSYDVNRQQPPYFTEFTYTELLGAVFVAPQSCEIAARMVDRAARSSDQGFDVASAVMERKRFGSLDKYTLSSVASAPRAVAFIPGSNCFDAAVSREALGRAMLNDPDLVIKPHPFTGDPLVQMLGREFGFARVMEPSESGDAYLRAAERIYTLATSEMGLYAVLLGKPIRNLGSFAHEARAPYHPFYRLLWDHPPERAREVLAHCLASPYSGVFHPDDPHLKDRAAIYFAAAMEERAPFRPLVREFPLKPSAG